MENTLNNAFLIGQKLKHYCCGEVVIGTIIERSEKHVKTSHKKIKWHNQSFTTTDIEIDVMGNCTPYVFRN